MQNSLFPSSFQVAPQDAELLNALLPDLHLLGYHIEPFGRNTFIIHGSPADVEPGNEASAIELLLEQFKFFSSELKFTPREKLIRSLAKQHAIKAGKELNIQEMQHLVSALFACAQPNVTPAGNPTYIEFKKDYLEKLFMR